MKEVPMVSMLQFKKGNHTTQIGVLMMIIAIIFNIYMLSSLISNTHEFWFTDLN